MRTDKVKLTIEHPWKIIFGSLVLIALCASGLRFISVETDYEVFFDGHNERLQAHRDIENLYGRVDSVLFTLKPLSGKVFTPEFLNTLEALTEAAWQIPYSNRVDSLTNFPYTYAEEDDLVVEFLFEDPLNMTLDSIQKRKAFALNDIRLENAINPDATVTGILVTVQLPEGNKDATYEVSDYVRLMANEFAAKHPDIEIYTSGSILLSEAFLDASTKGTGKLMSIMFVVCLILSGILLRSIQASFVMLVLAISSVMMALGIASTFGIPITGPSSSGPVIISAIAIANTIHLMSSYLLATRRGIIKTEALLDALKQNLKPIFLTSLTTTIGFLCLNLSDVPPYRYLGTTAAIGVVCGFILSFTLVPAILALLPLSKAHRNKHLTNTGLAKADQAIRKTDAWDKLGNFVAKNPKPLALSVLVLAAISSSLIPNNTIDDRLIQYFDKDTHIRSHSEFAMENLSPFYAMALTIPSHETGGISDPEYLRYLDKLTQWTRSQPEVQSVISLTDTYKQLNKNMHGDDDNWYKLPDSRELASQYLLLYELSLPYGKDLTNQIDIDKSASKLWIGFYDIPSSTMREFDQRMIEWMKRNIPDHMQSPPTGPPLLFAYIWNDATMSNVYGMLTAIALIAIVIAMAMKSIKLGIVSLIPNLIPAGMAYGVWSLINGQIDIGSSIVAVISFGIIVDDTIHFLSKYQKSRADGLSAEESIRECFSKVGRALCVTTVALIAGFLVLTSSHFSMNVSMGLLTSLAIGFALLLDFLLLPYILMKVDSQVKS